MFHQYFSFQVRDAGPMYILAFVGSLLIVLALVGIEQLILILSTSVWSAVMSLVVTPKSGCVHSGNRNWLPDHQIVSLI